MVAVKGEERVVTAQGSLGRVDKGHGVGEESVRAGGGHRDPPFVAGRPNLCGTSPNLYDNVHEVNGSVLCPMPLSRCRGRAAVTRARNCVGAPWGRSQQPWGRCLVDEGTLIADGGWW